MKRKAAANTISAVEEVVQLFGRSIDQGMGDLETMLAGIRYRLLHPGERLDPYARPPGYRSQNLRDQMKKEFGARRTSLWGGTALRGNFDPKKKAHIIAFLKAVNRLPDDRKMLETAFAQCARLYASKVNSMHPEIVLPKDAPIQRQLLQALNAPSEGKAQQGIVYALTRMLAKRQAPHRSVVTKATHAGDAQSAQLGDVQVLEAGKALVVYEVKAFPLDQAAVDRILPAHGRHAYTLFILTLGFKPPELQTVLCSMENTLALHLVDHCLAIFAGLCSISGESPQELLKELISTYNEEFCEQIENDPSIKIQVAEEG